MTIEEQFGPYEMALKLKKRGFNEPCLGTYNSFGDFIFSDSEYPFPQNTDRLYDILWLERIKPYGHTPDMLCTAPLWQQIIDWFRVKHNYSIEIYNYESTVGYIWMVKKVQVSLYGYGTTIDVESTNPVDYNVARLEAIEAAFELIDQL
jgi:hypothetical protein